MANKIRELPKGYTDTPVLPDSGWRVHDVARPAPPVVRPPSFSTQERPGDAPSDAVVLFDGSGFDAWAGRDGGAPKWNLVDGNAMEVAPRTGDIHTRGVVRQLPTAHRMECAHGDLRGQPGAVATAGYSCWDSMKIQVLDGYDNPTYADGLTAAIYGQHPPLVNACVPPGQWHVYDIVFETPALPGR